MIKSDKKLIVKEDLNFERGQDPKKAMGIGMREEIESVYSDLYEIEEQILDRLDDPYCAGQQDIIERVKPILERILGEK